MKALTTVASSVVSMAVLKDVKRVDNSVVSTVEPTAEMKVDSTV